MADVSRFSDVEAAKVAVGLEEDGFAFYSAIAAKDHNPRTRKVFDHLARAEKQHLVKFEALEKQLILGKGQYWDDPAVNAYIRALVDTKVFPREYSPAGYAEWLKTERDVLQFALQIEKDSALFYSVAAEHATTADTCATFGTIRGEEEKHVVWVSNALKAVAPSDK